MLNEEHVRALYSGAPQFKINKTAEGRLSPVAGFPWDEELKVKDVSDAVQLAQPAFSAATLHRHLPILHDSSEQDRQYHVYNVGVVETPSMLSAQGVEPGSVGFVYFLELPTSDSLITDLQQSQSSNGFLESLRNKEQMQNNPERLGIRRVDIDMVYDRLTEFGDLTEVFQDSPERMTILNNRSSGDLYANLFGKFLTPPAYDDSADDPTGMKVQIDTLLKILRLKGVWYDFSLVEWRIRLGQILWSEDELSDNANNNQLWTEREILLLQITLACELLLRLDAVTSMEPDEVKSQMHVTREDFEGFLKLKTRKSDWDLIMAQRFLDNILVVKDGNAEILTQTSKSRGLLSMLGREEPQTASHPDITLLPRHQVRQLCGLVHFAETMQWPGLDLVVKGLAQKLGVLDGTETREQPTSPYGKFLEPATPSSISIYGTPLATPRSTATIHDSYFGNVHSPPLDRDNLRSLTVPLSTSLLLANAADASVPTTNIGGWLSRSYLTGLILPGEAISHFLMSTLLENDRLAIAALGDSANLYGGFIYRERSWWSKASTLGRVLACLEGSTECMGWIALTTLPATMPDGWYAVASEPLRHEQPPRINAEEDLLSRDSAIIPGDDNTGVKADELTLPLDVMTPPIPSIEFTEWKLMPANSQTPASEEAPIAPSEPESHIACLTFTSFAGKTHVISLSYDVQFVTSFPCTPPSTSSSPNTPHVTKKPLSRSASQRSIHSARPRHPSRRNSHGFEPLLSHPPDSPSLMPTQIYTDEQPADKSTATTPKPEPLRAHPLHVSYKYKVISAADVLDSASVLAFRPNLYASPAPSDLNTPQDETAGRPNDGISVLVLDARASKDLELLSRAWCAEKGLHALVSRVGRTCLACSIREAGGLGINVVVRV